MSLSLHKCRRQCYDWASKTSGSKGGVATQIMDPELREINTRWYGHALNLIVGGTVRQSKSMHDALDNTHQISKLLKLSSKRDLSVLAHQTRANTRDAMLPLPKTLSYSVDRAGGIKCLWKVLGSERYVGRVRYIELRDQTANYIFSLPDADKVTTSLPSC